MIHCTTCGNDFRTDEDYFFHRHQPSRFLEDVWYDVRTGRQFPSRQGDNLQPEVSAK